MTGARPLDWLRAVCDDHRTRGGGVLAVALVLGTKAKGAGPKTGCLYAAMSDLADRSGLSGRQVRRHLAELGEAGYLVRTRVGHRKGDGTRAASEWRLCLPAKSQPDTDDRLSEPESPSLPDTSDRLRPSQPDIEPVSTGHQRPTEAVSTGHESTTKREEQLEKSSSHARDAGDYLIGSLRGRFTRDLTAKEQSTIIAALAEDDDPHRIARLVSSEVPPAAIHSPAQYVLNRIGAARAGEIAVRVGGPAAPASAFPESGIMEGWARN